MSGRRDEERESFDRGRILEWLENIHVHQQLTSENDEGSEFDPDRPQAASQQQQQQQQQQQHQQNVPRVHHLSAFLQRQRLSAANVTVPMISVPVQPLVGAQRTQSLGSLSLERANLAATDISFAQPHTHFRGLHTRQKSESPLPEIPVDSELPNFDPQTPVPPGNRTPRQTTRSEITASRHQQPILIHARSGHGSVTLSSPALHPSLETSVRSPSPLTSRYQTGGRGSAMATEALATERAGEEEDQDVSQIPQGQLKHLLPSSSSSHTDNKHQRESLEHDSDTPDAPVPCNEQIISLPESQLHSSLLSSQTVVSPTPRRTLPPDSQEGEEDRVDVVPLSSVELASLSLKVVDILPQLAVYLGVGYCEYERVVESEPSPQRQSISVLMKWYRSGDTCADNRETLAKALEHFGDQYSQLAQLLRRGELEESRHSGLSEESLRHQKLSPSPSPAPLILPPAPPAHPSPDHKPHSITTAAGSPSPSPSSTLSPHSRKMKQGFTFDDERRSSDILPKFLSTRSLFTTSPESHPSSLLSGVRTPRSQPIQRQLSLSDISSSSASSWPAGPRVGRASWRDSAYPSRRKSSLPQEDLANTSGCGFVEGGRGLSERYGMQRKSSLENEDILRSLREDDDRGIPTVESDQPEMIVRTRVGTGSVDLGGGTQGGNPLHYRVISSRVSQAGSHPSSVGSTHHLPGSLHRPGLSPGGRGRREHLGVSGPHDVGVRSLPRGLTGLTTGAGRNSRRAIDRQDSGIETISSNLSTNH